LVKRGLAWKATAWPPTTRYLTRCAAKHANNALKSLGGLLAVLSLDPLTAQVFDDGHPLVGGELGPELAVGLLLLVEAGDLSHPDRHQLILPQASQSPC
jgi:hypothetical protein